MPDLSDDKPIYQQIRDFIENSILTGSLQEQEQVPSTNQFAAFYRINPATAAKGINILVEEGVLYKKRGVGMFVSTGAREIIQEKRKRSFYQDYVLPLLKEAEKLAISKERVTQYIMGEGKGKYNDC